MAQSAASLQAAATCSTRLSLPPKRFQLTSCSPRLIRPSEEEGRCILSSCRTHLHVQRTGWKRSLPDELPERASGLAEIRGELVPRFAGKSYLATDNGPFYSIRLATDREPIGRLLAGSRRQRVQLPLRRGRHQQRKRWKQQPAREIPSNLTVLKLVDIPRIIMERERRRC